MQWTRSAQASQYTAPRTVLGFFLAIVAIIVFGGAALMHALDGAYAAQMLGAGGVLIVIIVGIVVYAMFKAPMALMLGEVKGTEFLEHQRLTRGDSILGEYIDTPGVAPGPTAGIGSGTVNEQEEGEV